MPLHRMMTALKISLIAGLLAAALPTAAMEVAFGYLGKDNVIERIMYYQNGSWQKPLSASLTATGQFSSGIEPHDAIVKAWLNAQSSAELDCTHADPRQYDASHCLYTKKLHQRLSATSAKELSTFLVGLPPRTRSPVNAERTQIFSPDMLTRLLAWKALKSDTPDMEAYAKIFWGTTPSAFINWFSISQPDPPARVAGGAVLSRFMEWLGLQKPLPTDIESRSGVFLNANAGGCFTGAPSIKVQPSRSAHENEEWVATQKWGYRWIPFEKIVDNNFDPQSGAAHPGNTETPILFASLVNHVRKNWEAAEGRIVPHKLKLGPLGRQEALKQLRATPLRKLTVERAVSYQNRSTLLMFYGEKTYRPPNAAASNEGATLDIAFRAWAIRHPEGRTEWISSRIDLDPSASAIAHVDETITSISPYALLEIDGKQYVIATSNLNSAKSSTLRTEVFELVNYQFKSRGIYGGACSGTAASK